MLVGFKDLLLVVEFTPEPCAAFHGDGVGLELFLRVVHLGNTITESLKKSSGFLKKVSWVIHSAL